MIRIPCLGGEGMGGTRTTFIVIVFTALLSACSSPEEPQSDVKIDAGRFITGESTNKVPGVVSIGGCTATAVSDNTLITAGHCVSRGREVCIRSGRTANGKCSNKVYTPDAWERKDYIQDIAVVVFPAGTFKHYFEVATSEIQARDPIVMVGYSQYSIADADRGKGSKRWGRNSVSHFDPGKVIITRYGGTADSVAVNPGDSGGPMFDQSCKLVGVTSRTSAYGTFQGKTSLHTNVQYTRNMQFLRGLTEQGATYCGIPGLEGSHCARTGLAEVIANTESDQFPCSETGGELSKVFGLVSGKGAAVDLFLSAEANVESLRLCEGASACEESGGFPVAFHVSKNGRKIFKTAGKLNLNVNNEFLGLGLDAQGKVVSRTKMRVFN